MKVTISSGHGLKVRGAKGILDEVDEARKVVGVVAGYLKQLGVGVNVYHDNSATTQAANLNNIVNAHNKTARDWDVSIHFNAGCGKNGAGGVEVLHYNAATKGMANKVSSALAKALGLPNRGAKQRTDLRFLKGTAKPAILIEVCFVEATSNASAYRKNFDKACRAIAEAIAGKTLPKAGTSATKTQPTGKKYRVVTGVFNSREDAQKIANALKKNYGTTVYIKEE